MLRRSIAQHADQARTNAVGAQFDEVERTTGQRQLVGAQPAFELNVDGRQEILAEIDRELVVGGRADDADILDLLG